MIRKMLLGIAILGLGIGQQAMSEELKVGSEAPEFALKGSDGKTYKLSQFKGKKYVVVAWYPKALTGG